MHKRDAAIDLVRVAGIAAIVAGHVWESEFTWFVFYPWHVPVFFFLSGYLWKTTRSLTAELAARGRSLLKPYLLWFALIFTAWLTVSLRTGNVSLKGLMAPVYGGFYAGRPFSTFWFVFVLFAAAVGYRVLQYLPFWVRAVAFSGALLASVSFGEILAKSPLAIGSALPALLFVAAGQVARSYQSRLSRPGLLGLGLILVGAAAVATHLSAPMNIKQGDWGTPVLSILVACALSWGLVLSAQAVTRHLPARVQTGTTAVAMGGFTVVLVHPSVLWLLRADPQHGNVLVFAAAFIWPAVIAAIALRTPLSQWATGMPRVPREILQAKSDGAAR